MIYSIENFRYGALKMQGPLLTSTTWGLASSAIFFVIAYAFFGLPLIPTIISAAAFGALGGCMQYQALQSTKEPTDVEEPTGAKESTPRKLLDLPNEILWNIMDTLLESDPLAAVRFGRTCRKAHTVFEERSFYFNPTRINVFQIPARYFGINNLRALQIQLGADKFIRLAHEQSSLLSSAPSSMQLASPTYRLSASQTEESLIQLSSLNSQKHHKFPSVDLGFLQRFWHSVQVVLNIQPTEEGLAAPKPVQTTQINWNTFQATLEALEYLNLEWDELSKLHTQEDNPLEGAIKMLRQGTAEIQRLSTQPLILRPVGVDYIDVTVRAFRILFALWKRQNPELYKKHVLEVLASLKDFSHSEWIKGNLDLYKSDPEVFYEAIQSYHVCPAYDLLIAMGLQMYTEMKPLRQVNRLFTEASAHIHPDPPFFNYQRFELYTLLAIYIHTGQLPNADQLVTLSYEKAPVAQIPIRAEPLPIFRLFQFRMLPGILRFAY